MPSRVLVITGDDFGYCPDRNRGIIACFQNGGISQASLMVNAVATEEACALAKQHKLPTGLHFNITEGHPVAHAQFIPSLLDANGLFHGVHLPRRFWTVDVKRATVNQDHVRTEMVAQIERYKTLMGSLPPYVDGHNHIHIYPGVRDVFADVLALYKIPFTRMPVELAVEQCDWLTPERWTFAKRMCDYGKESMEVFTKNSIGFSSHFIGHSTMGEHMTTGHVTDALKRIPYNGVTAQTDDVISVCELMTHPGYPTSGEGGCGLAPDEFAKSPDRIHELQALQSKEMKDVFKQSGYTLKSFSLLS